MRLNSEPVSANTKRATASVCARLEKNLRAYTTAATSAGVSLLVLAQPTGAKIIFTPAQIPIVVNGSPTLLDLNHDGINDFGFSNFSRSFGNGSTYFKEALAVRALQQANGVLGGAAALGKGHRVGPLKPFSYGGVMACFSRHSMESKSYGPWLHTRGAYLGLKFTIHGKTHFGWARIKMGGLGNNDTITGYAYETIPNKSIITGARQGADETSKVGDVTTAGFPSRQHDAASLGILANGARTLEVWRRKDEVQAVGTEDWLCEL
jgi:hypothetical protein